MRKHSVRLVCATLVFIFVAGLVGSLVLAGDCWHVREMIEREFLAGIDETKRQIERDLVSFRAEMRRKYWTTTLFYAFVYGGLIYGIRYFAIKPADVNS